MIDSLYLAWKYLVYHKGKTTILVCSITLIIFLPAGLGVLVNESAEQLRARAGSYSGHYTGILKTPYFGYMVFCMNPCFG